VAVVSTEEEVAEFEGAEIGGRLAALLRLLPVLLSRSSTSPTMPTDK